MSAPNAWMGGSCLLDGSCALARQDRRPRTVAPAVPPRRSPSSSRRSRALPRLGLGGGKSPVATPMGVQPSISAQASELRQHQQRTSSDLLQFALIHLSAFAYSAEIIQHNLNIALRFMLFDGAHASTSAPKLMDATRPHSPARPSSMGVRLKLVVCAAALSELSEQSPSPCPTGGSVPTYHHVACSPDLPKGDPQGCAALVERHNECGNGAGKWQVRVPIGQGIERVHSMVWRIWISAELVASQALESDSKGFATIEGGALRYTGRWRPDACRDVAMPTASACPKLEGIPRESQSSSGLGRAWFGRSIGRTSGAPWTFRGTPVGRGAQCQAKARVGGGGTVGSHSIKTWSKT